LGPSGDYVNTFNLYLTDLFALLTQQLYFNIAGILKGYFDRVVAASGAFAQSSVIWIPAIPPVLQPYELVLHFVPLEFSVAAVLSGKRGDPQINGHWGMTSWTTNRTLTVSEVIVKSLEADILAKLAFHELMHNKLTNDLHAGMPPQPVPQMGLASPVLDQSTNLSQGNVDAMARDLRVIHPQWTDAYQELATRAVRRGNQDPLWYL
jgi:hypothetical protein